MMIEETPEVADLRALVRRGVENAGGADLKGIAAALTSEIVTETVLDVLQTALLPMVEEEAHRSRADLLKRVAEGDLAEGGCLRRLPSTTDLKTIVQDLLDDSDLAGLDELAEAAVAAVPDSKLRSALRIATESYIREIYDVRQFRGQLPDDVVADIMAERDRGLAAGRELEIARRRRSSRDGGGRHE